MSKCFKNEFSIEFLWKIINHKNGTAIYSSSEMDDMNKLFVVLFPGIKLLYMHRYEVLVNYCIPALYRQFPQLRKCHSLEIAKSQLGNTLTVEKEKDCDGYEWVNWELIQSS